MYFDNLFGPVAVEHGWVPAPSYSLRRRRVLELTAEWPEGDLLEVGCGAGTLLCEFGRKGFDCTGLDASFAARELAGLVNMGEARVQIVESSEPGWLGRFDYLLAFEVLEHIENDLDALRGWYDWLKPGGVLLLSVPAHQRRWSPSDLWAGHFRRYERQDLERLLEVAGFEVDVVDCYGFPIANVVDPLRSFNHARILRKAAKAGAQTDRESLNQQSGVSRSLEATLFPLQRSGLGKLVFKLGFKLQARVSAREWGTGFLVMATRPMV